MKSRSRAITVCSVLLLTGVTSVADSPGPTMPGVAGDSWSYMQDVTITNLTNNAVVSLTDGVLKRTVLQSKQPGRLLVQELAKDFKVPTGVQPPKAYLANTTSYFSDGTVDTIVEGADPASYRLMNLETIKLPSAALAVGLGWSWKASADSAKGTLPVEAYYKVTEDGAYEGIPAWRIEFSSRELSPNAAIEQTKLATMEGTIWLRKSDLLMLSVSDEGTYLPVPGTDDLIKRKATTMFITDSETRAPVTSTSTAQSP